MIYIWTKQWSAYLWPEHWKEISYNGESVTQHSVNYAGCSSSQTGVNVERRWSAAVSTLASGWWHSLVDTVSYCSAEVWLGPRTTTEAALGTSGWPGCRISNASPHLRFPLHPGRHLPHLWVLLIHAWGSQSSTPEFRSWNSTCCLQRALASLGWVSLVDWHPHPSTFLAKLLPREAHSMPSTSPAFLSCSADLPGDISQRHLFFLLTEEFGLPGSPWQASPPSLFSCSPRLPLSFLAAGQRGKLARHRGSRGKGTSPGSWIKVRKREPQHGHQGPASSGTWEVLGDGPGQLPLMEVSHSRQKNMRDFKSWMSITGQGWEKPMAMGKELSKCAHSSVSPTAMVQWDVGYTFQSLGSLQKDSDWCKNPTDPLAQ